MRPRRLALPPPSCGRRHPPKSPELPTEKIPVAVAQPRRDFLHAQPRLAQIGIRPRQALLHDEPIWCHPREGPETPRELRTRQPDQRRQFIDRIRARRIAPDPLHDPHQVVVLAPPHAVHPPGRHFAQQKMQPSDHHPPRFLTAEVECLRQMPRQPRRPRDLPQPHRTPAATELLQPTRHGIRCPHVHGEIRHPLTDFSPPLGAQIRRKQKQRPRRKWPNLSFVHEFPRPLQRQPQIEIARPRASPSPVGTVLEDGDSPDIQIPAPVFKIPSHARIVQILLP